jgi:cell volume regulation protein A
MTEPSHIALGLAVLGVLMGASVLLSRVAGRMSVPVALLFLVVGMLAGSEGVGRISFEDYSLSFRLGTVTLVLILFDGGLNAHWGAVRKVIAPATMLATIGVVITTALVALGARLLGFGWTAAFLLGAIVSSTDAAAVFSVLRGSRIELNKRVATTLELESGLNDPVAVILTLALTGVQAGKTALGWGLVLELALELVIGLAAGVALGLGGRWLLSRARPAAAGLLPVFTVALAFVAYGATTLIHGSGFLATFVTAVIIGNAPIPYRSGLHRVHDALAWLGQVLMFLVLGLLSFPTRMWAVAPIGMLLGLLLAFVARPLSVMLCLLPFRFPMRELAFVSWVGLRGAVPIILAMIPVFAGVPDGTRLFDVVFFIVVVNAFVPGSTVKWAARKLQVEVYASPPPAAALEIASTLPLESEVLSFYLEPSSAVVGATVADVPLPAEAAVMLVVRGERLVAPRGETLLAPGDHVLVFCHPEDKRMVSLLFGRQEE